MPHKFKTIDEARYDEALGCLPPALWLSHGFLVGEPYSYRRCEVTGHGAETFTALFCTKPDIFDQKIHGHQAAFYEAVEPMTAAEFRAVRLDDIRADLTD